MAKPKVTVLFDCDTEPPEVQDWSREVRKDDKAEFDIGFALQKLGYPYTMLGFRRDLKTILDGLEEHKPELVFNMVEAWQDEAALDFAVVGILEILRIPYTGSPPFALQLTRDKAVSKKILDFEGIRVPEFHVFRRDKKLKKPEDLQYPIIVKPLLEDASLGISKASVAQDWKALRERIKFIHDSLYNHAIAEELIVGREIYLGILGNDPPKALAPVEMVFRKEKDDEMKIATHSAKWSKKYRKDKGIRNVVAKDIKGTLLKKIRNVGIQTYRKLHLKDYARIDLRVTPEGDVYVIEANPNPFLAMGEDMAIAARAAGLDYNRLIETIVKSALTSSKAF